MLPKRSSDQGWMKRVADGGNRIEGGFIGEKKAVSGDSMETK